MIFCEFRIDGVLRSSDASLVLWSTYTPLTKEYAALVTGGAEPCVIRSNPPRVAHRVEETMMRQSETMRAASRLLLSHPIVCLLAALAAVVVVGVLGPIKVVHAADVAVEGENFAKPPGTTVVSDTLFSEGKALKFTADVTASHTDTVTCSTPCDVVLMARAGQSGGTPSFSVNGSAPQDITTSNQVAPEPYRFMNLPAGSNEIRVTASGTGTGHNAFLDVAKFPADGGGGGGLTYIGSATGDTGTTPQVKVTVPVPPGTKQGDFMLALLQADYGNVGGTLPSGWKLIKEHLEGRDLSLHAYYKIAAAKEPPSYTWNVVNAALHPLAGGTILTFRGVDRASPVFANTVNPETTNRAKINCPSVNAPNGGMLVCGFTHDDPQPDIKVPASMTRVSNFIIRNDDAHAVAYEPIAKAGATGLRSATINPNLKGGGNDISMAISLRPSAVNSSSP